MLKILLKTFLSMLTILSSLLVIWWLYLWISPYTSGPKHEVQAVCESIQVGTSLGELTDQFYIWPQPNDETALLEALLKQIKENEINYPSTLEELNGQIVTIYEELDYYSYLDLGYHPRIESFLQKELRSNKNQMPNPLLKELLERLQVIESQNGRYVAAENGRVQIHSQVQGNWLCICSVELKDAQVEQTNNVFCTD